MGFYTVNRKCFAIFTPGNIKKMSSPFLNHDILMGETTKKKKSSLYAEP
jgi:hypothetical protein